MCECLAYSDGARFVCAACGPRLTELEQALVTPDEAEADVLQHAIVIAEDGEYFDREQVVALQAIQQRYYQAAQASPPESLT